MTEPVGAGVTTCSQNPQKIANPQPGTHQDKHACITHTKVPDVPEKYAENLEEALQAHGYQVFREAGEEGLLIAVMEKCDKVIMMISKAYLESSKYAREIQCIEMLTSKRRKQVLIPVLCKGMKYEDLPHRLKFGSAVPGIGATKEYPMVDNENYWKTIVENVDTPFPVLSSDGVGYGLACGHFEGYLKFILPDLGLRIQHADKMDWDIRADAILCNKMIAIFPHKGRLVKKLSDFDSDIQSVCYKGTETPVKVEHAIDFPGHPKKDFSCGIFKTTVNNKEYVFFAEIPATLNTLTNMRDSEFYSLTEDAYQRELELVKASLENILRNYNDEFIDNRLASFAFLDYDDRDILPENRRGSLSEKIAQVIADRLYLDRK